MKIKKQEYLFIFYFLIIYTLLSILFLQTIATNFINLWEYLIKIVFGNFFNYQAFIFVPECSGVISIAIYLGIVIAAKITYYKKIDIKRLLGSINLLLLANFIRLLIVLSSEKLSLSVAKVTHVVFWFLMGLVILYLAMKSFRKL
jgi:exosortase/archaeosortase family protein